jgi:lipopolysaccharide assembly outer membrane protein LptD (OstA)
MMVPFYKVFHKFAGELFFGVVILLIAGPGMATVMLDPGGSDLSQIVIGGTLPSVVSETGLTSGTAPEGTEYTGKGSVAVYESPFNTPLKEGETRYWVDPDLGWIEYRVPENLIILKNRAQMEYSDIHLQASEVFYHSDSKIIDASGEAKLADSQGEVEGERMTYSFQTKKGVVYSGESKIETGFFRGRKVKKIAENVLCASYGVFTSCEYAQSHYEFWSPKVKIYVNDKVIAKPVIVKLQGIPILALPYYILSLKRERHSGFLPPYLRYIGGHYYIINNGYFWAINDYCDLTTMLDYNSKKGWGQKLNFNYLFGSASSVNSAYIAHYRERDTLKEWWKVYSSHRQDIGLNTYALLRLDLRSDTAFDRYFDESFAVRTKRELSSFATLTRNFGSLSTVTEVSRTITTNKESQTGEIPQSYTSAGNITQDLFPRFTLTSPKINLFSSKIFMGWSGSFENRYTNKTLYDRSAQTKLTFSRPFHLLGILQLEPSLSGSGEWYWQDKNKKPNLFLGTYSFQTSASTRIYGIFHPYQREFRHIIAPWLSYSYTPPYDTSLRPTGGGNSPGTSVLGFSLGQSFVLMPKKTDNSGESSTEQAVTILDWTSGLSYDFKKSYRPLSDLTTTMNIAPTFNNWYSIDTRLSMRHSLYDRLLQQFDFSTAFTLKSPSAVQAEEEKLKKQKEGEGGTQGTTMEDYLSEDPYRTDSYGQRQLGVGEGIGKGWNLSLNYNYSKYRYSQYGFQTVSGTLSFPIASNWKISYDSSYDIFNNRFQSQMFRIYRDLHCWEAEVRITYEQNVVEYWFEIRIKEIPEVKLYGGQQRTL